MTIKNQLKNISAETDEICITDVSISNGILSFARKNFYDDKENPLEAITIDLKDIKLRLKRLDSEEDLNIYRNPQQASYGLTQEEIARKLVERETYIFLVPLNNANISNKEEGVFREYLWFDNKNDFEVIGSTTIDLDPIRLDITRLQGVLDYEVKEENGMISIKSKRLDNIEETLVGKFDKVNVENSLNFSENNSIKALSAYQGKVLNDNKSDKNHGHGNIDKDGKLNATTSSVKNVLVTDTSNAIKSIFKLPESSVTHQDISGKANIEDVPTKTSDLINDGNGTNAFTVEGHTHIVTDVTDFPDDLATESDVENAIETANEYTDNAISSVGGDSIITKEVLDELQDAYTIIVDAKEVCNHTELADLREDQKTFENILHVYDTVEDALLVYANDVHKDESCIISFDDVGIFYYTPDRNSKEEISGTVNLIQIDLIQSLPVRIQDVVDEMGFVTLVDLADYLKDVDVIDNLKSDNPSKPLSARQGKALLNSIPSKTSDLTNDSGFVTTNELPDISQIVVPTKISDLENDSEFIDKDVDNLTNYTKTSDLNIPEQTSDLYNDSEYVDSTSLSNAISNHNTFTRAHANILDNKVDKEEGKGLSQYDFNKSYKNAIENLSSTIQSRISSHNTDSSAHSDLIQRIRSDFSAIIAATQNEINSALDDKVDKIEGMGLSEKDFTTEYESNLKDLVDSSKTIKNGHTHNYATSNDIDTKISTHNSDSNSSAHSSLFNSKISKVNNNTNILLANGTNVSTIDSSKIDDNTIYDDGIGNEATDQHSINSSIDIALIDLKSHVSNKQTKNLSTSMTTDTGSNEKYPSVKAVEDKLQSYADKNHYHYTAEIKPRLNTDENSYTYKYDICDLTNPVSHPIDIVCYGPSVSYNLRITVSGGCFYDETSIETSLENNIQSKDFSIFSNNKFEISYFATEWGLQTFKVYDRDTGLLITSTQVIVSGQRFVKTHKSWGDGIGYIREFRDETHAYIAVKSDTSYPLTGLGTTDDTDITLGKVVNPPQATVLARVAPGNTDTLRITSSGYIIYRNATANSSGRKSVNTLISYPIEYDISLNQ